MVMARGLWRFSSIPGAFLVLCFLLTNRGPGLADSAIAASSGVVVSFSSSQQAKVVSASCREDSGFGLFLRLRGGDASQSQPQNDTEGTEPASPGVVVYDLRPANEHDMPSGQGEDAPAAKSYTAVKVSDDNDHVSVGVYSEHDDGTLQGTPPVESDDVFSVGGASDASVGTAEGGAQGGDGFEAVDCTFERIGDTNGVFYYLGARHQSEHGPTLPPDSKRIFVNPAKVSEHGPTLPPDSKRIFVNPAKVVRVSDCDYVQGRVKILAGPMRCMCAEKFQGRAVQPEDVLQRNVIGDEFWFPDGFFAIDLGNHTTLQPTHYMMRNGGAIGEVTTGWVLEGANHVEGKWWRVGDWKVLDEHINTTSFLDPADQCPGYTDWTHPPTKIDPRTGREICTIPRQLFWTWQPTPIGEKPHHTHCFKVYSTGFYRYFRLRQLTNRQNTHGIRPVGNKNFYVQGFELYGDLRIGKQQQDMPLHPQSCPPAQWYLGINDPDLWETVGPQWAMEWLRDKEDQTELDIETAKAEARYVDKLWEMFGDKPAPRSEDELSKLTREFGTGEDSSELTDPD